MFEHHEGVRAGCQFAQGRLGGPIGDGKTSAMEIETAERFDLGAIGEKDRDVRRQLRKCGC